MLGSAAGRSGMVGDEETDNLARAVPPSEQVIVGWGWRVVASFVFLAEVDECLPERPAAAAGPGRFVQVQTAAECRSAVTGEELPFHDQVIGRVADGHAPEVDDRMQCPARDE